VRAEGRLNPVRGGNGAPVRGGRRQMYEAGGDVGAWASGGIMW
jgi:hypothetical protein